MKNSNENSFNEMFSNINESSTTESNRVFDEMQYQILNKL